MPTSVAQLLDVLTALAAESDPSDVVAADGAVRALGQLGRALDLLDGHPGGAESVAEARRRLVSSELAKSARRAAAQWPPSSHRSSDLAGAAADLIGTSVAGLGGDERWAGAIMVAHASRDCVAAAARFPPYANVPALAPVLRLSGLVGQLARLDPPGAASGGWLDAGVPTIGAGAGAGAGADRSSAVAVVDATAGLVTSLRRELADGTLHVYALVAACAAAEAVAALAQAVSVRRSSLAGSPVAQTWRVLQGALVRFDDGSRFSTDPASRVTEYAFTLHTHLTHLARTRGDPLPIAESLTATRYAANHLPALADLAGAAVARWADCGRLLARARSLPRSEHHVAAVLRDQVVMVTPRDVGPVLMAARATARLSVSLAVDLDRSAGPVGQQPQLQPRLLAALRAQLNPELHPRDAHWATTVAARIDAMRPSVLHAPPGR